MQNPLPGLKELLGILESWDGWRRIVEAPSRVDELEKKVAALEAALSKKAAPAKPTGETCPRCKEPAWHIESSRSHPTFGRLGALERTMKCDACGFTEKHMHKPN